MNDEHQETAAPRVPLILTIPAYNSARSAVIMVRLLSVKIFQVAVCVPHRWSVLLSSSCHRACSKILLNL